MLRNMYTTAIEEDPLTADGIFLLGVLSVILIGFGIVLWVLRDYF